MFCFVFCMFIFLGVLAKELLHSCFFFPGFFFGKAPPFTPFEKVLFLSGKKPRDLGGRPVPPTATPGGLLRDASQPAVAGAFRRPASARNQMMLGENEEKHQFWLGFIGDYILY